MLRLRGQEGTISKKNPEIKQADTSEIEHPKSEIILPQPVSRAYQFFVFLNSFLRKYH